MKIKLKDYRKYIQLKQIEAKNENQELINETKERISSRSLWNFFLGQDDETAHKWIEYLLGKRNEPNGLSLPRSISMPFKIFYSSQENFKKEFEMISYIEENKFEDFVEVGYAEGRKIVNLLSIEKVKEQS